MDHLAARERELVALGVAIASNCVPCVQHHIPEARKAGLTDAQIFEAIRLADSIRQVPARKVLDVALEILTGSSASAESAGASGAATRAASSVSAWCCR